MILTEKSGTTFQVTPFRNEAELQDLIEKYPRILDPIPKMGGLELPLLILGREFMVQSGAIDFLALDSDGELYIIETKLAENPEQRRTVIGQVLEYASNLRDMNAEEFSKKCRNYLGKPVEKVVQSCLVDTESADDIAVEATETVKRAAENREAGKFTIVVVTNNINFEIQRLFSFLDEMTQINLNFLVLEVNRYLVQDAFFIHSNVVWAAKYIRSLYSRKTVTETEYLTSKSEHVRSIIQFIDRWCTDRGLTKAQTTKGISWKSSWGGSIFVSNDWLDTNWSTIHVTSKDFVAFKQKQMDAGRKQGFKLRGFKRHGGFRLPLDNGLQQTKVETYLQLVYEVLEKAKELST